MTQMPPLDPDGYLLDIQDWTEEAARSLAADEDIELTAAHWDIIHLARAFYKEFGVSPRQRPLVQYIKNKLGADKGNSIYLMTLFPGSPALRIARISGLPRPSQCF